MARDGTAQYRQVHGLSRGLDVLHALNTGRGGELGLAQVAERTGLHRTTVRRLLETLVSDGYVRRSPSDKTFRLTMRVRALSEGFTDDEWIAQAAPPILGDLLRQVVWPTDLCTAEGTAMVIRETTHRFSPLSFHQSMVGVRLPMLLTATGRAYLAFCPKAERSEILGLLKAGTDFQSGMARSTKIMSALMNETIAAGYGSIHRDWPDEPKMAAIALPIHHDERVMGALNLVFLASAMSVAEAARRYLSHLQAAVTRIEAVLG